MNDDQVQKIVEQHRDALGEHFDNVLVMVSWQEGTKTRCIKRRYGNYHSALGMAHEYISESKADDIGASVAAKIEPPEPPEEWKKA